MRNSLLQLVFGLLLLVLGAGAEDLLPRVFGVGFPVLLVLAQLVARRGAPLAFSVFAIAAGAMADALGALPPAASASFFLASAWLVNRLGFARAAAALTYPVYLVWLAVWTGACDGGIFARLLVSVPVGFATAGVVGVVYAWAERRAAFDEVG